MDAHRPFPPPALGLVLVGVGVACWMGLAASADARQAPAPADHTGSVTGDVQVVVRSSRRLVSAGAYPGRTIGLQADRDPSELANVVVFVKTRAATTPTRAVIRQTDEEFVPHVVAIGTGSVVEFPNDDLIFHNVFSLSRVATFDLGRYPKGRTKSRTFTQPGIVKVFCQLHSHMSAIVRIFDHPHFAIPDANGRFTIRGVAPGAYDVVAWHERVGEVTQHLLVATGQTTAVSFALPLKGAP